mgnify:CR=1 FL=1
MWGILARGKSPGKLGSVYGCLSSVPGYMRKTLMELCRSGQADGDCPLYGDIIGGLREYREQRTAAAWQTYVDTSTSRPLIDGLDYARDNHCLVVIEGHSGRGKSAGAQAWTAANLHRARNTTPPSPPHSSSLFGSAPAPVGL